MARKRYKGKRSGRLELVEYSRPGGPGVGAIWRAVCDCGRTCEVRARDITSGKRKTCGNCTKELGIESGRRIPDPTIPRGYKEHYNDVIRQMTREGTISELSPTKYVELIGKRCVGCNVLETRPELTAPGSTMLVPICRTCSEWRGGRNVEKWLEHCVRVGMSVRSRAG